MKKLDSRLQHFSNALAIGTGVAYAWTKYFGRAADPYSRASSPWQPLWHDSHVVTVPLLVFACGLIWHNHILPKWHGFQARGAKDSGPGKAWSGLALLAVAVPMIATGYLIQVSVDDAWRRAWVAVHLVTSAAWAASYLAHFVWPGKARRSRARR